MFLSLRYVSRVNYLDSSKHAILGTQQFRPKEFATQIALNMDNAWGILRCIIDTCMKLPDGKYLILKDPLKVRQNTLLSRKVHSLQYPFGAKIETDPLGG